MRKKSVIIVFIIFLIVALTGGGMMASNVYIKVKGFENYIYPNVTIQGEDMSGKTMAEAKQLLIDKYQKKIQNNKISISVNNKSYTLNYSDINANYDVDKAVKEAYNYGKDLSFINKYKLIKGHVLKTIKLSFSYSNESKPIDKLINIIKNDVNKAPKNSSIKKTNSGFDVTLDEDGYKLKDTELKSNIISAINSNNGNDININASGEIVKAKVTKEKLESINTLISTFSTSYGSISSYGRAINIQLATKAINGIFLMPGDTFSFNGTVGERTAAKGYQEAPVDIGKKTGMGLVGGICQVSTTLYNAVLLSGIKATVRMHHSIPSRYVPLGYDATVDYGTLDYQFKNTLNFPIYIEGISTGGRETFNIYSNSTLLTKTYKVATEVYDNGLKVKVYLQTFQDGILIASDLIADDSY